MPAPLLPHPRIHIGTPPAEGLRDELQGRLPGQEFSWLVGETNPKPRGLWWAHGDAWARHSAFMNGEPYDPVRDLPDGHVFRVDFVPEARIAHLSTLEDLRAFAAEFGGPVVRGFGWIDTIDWRQVTERYDGVEVLHIPASGEGGEWAVSWDIPSGCVWRASAVRALVPVPPRALRALAAATIPSMVSTPQQEAPKLGRVRRR